MENGEWKAQLVMKRFDTERWPAIPVSSAHLYTSGWIPIVTDKVWWSEEQFWGKVKILKAFTVSSGTEFFSHDFSYAFTVQ